MNCEQNLQLENKYISNGNFMNQMIGISKKFKEFEQQSYYSQLQESSKSMIITILANSELAIKLNNQQDLDYFVVIGAKQPNGNNAIEKTLLNIIHLIPRPKKAYSIIYINTLAAKNSFDDFKKVTEFLPIQYFLNLGKIYVLNASFLSKATSWITFNIITNFVKQKMIHVKDFHELIQFTGLNPNQLLKLLPQEIQKELGKKQEFVQSLMIYATKMMNFIGVHQNDKLQTLPINEIKKQQEQSQKMKPQKKTPQKEIQSFEKSVSKSSVVFLTTKKASKRHIQDYQIGQSGAPIPLQALLYYFNQRDNLLNTEGIFRKSVSIDEQNQLLAQIDYENYDFIQTVTDPHLIANAIKRFLSYLILPVVPYSQYMQMMQAKPEKLSQTVIHIIQNLPQLRKKTLLIVLEFMMERVIPKQNMNKMNIKNISIVIGPCLMRSQVSSFKDLIYSQKIIAVMLTIFKEFDLIFGNKKERILALRKTAKDYNRAYLEVRLGGLQAKINDPFVKASELTPSQFIILQPNPTKSEQKQEQQQSSSSNFKLLRRVTYSMKQELVQSIQKHEDEDLEEANNDEMANQLKKQIQQHIMIVSLGDAKLSEEDYLDI